MSLEAEHVPSFDVHHGSGAAQGDRWKSVGFFLRIYRTILKFSRFYVAIFPDWRIKFWGTEAALRRGAFRTSSAGRTPIPNGT